MHVLSGAIELQELNPNSMLNVYVATWAYIVYLFMLIKLNSDTKYINLQLIVLILIAIDQPYNRLPITEYK